MTRRDDEGTVLVLILGFVGILVILVAVVVDVSAVILSKRAAAGAADAAAISAVQAVDLSVVYAGELGGRLPLDPAVAAARVAAYETVVRPQQPGLDLTLTLEGSTAVVTATRVVRLPFFVPGSSRTTTIRAVARAQAPTAP